MSYSGVLSEVSARMESLEKKLETLELLICKDSVSSTNVVPFSLQRIDLTLDAIWKSLMVLHDRIETIVPKVDTLMNMVQSLQPPLPKEEPAPTPGTPSFKSIVNISSDDDSEWLNSLMQDQGFMDTLDISCLETPLPSPLPSNGLASTSNGFMDLPDQVSLEEHMSAFQTPILRTPGPNGGMDTA